MMPFERMVAWVFGGSEDDAEAIEAHVLECPDCTRVAHRLLDVRDAIRGAFLAGQIRCVATPALVDAMEVAGLETRSYNLAPGAVVPCSATSTQHYAITRLSADLGGMSRVDLEVTTEGDNVLERIPDAPFSLEAKAVLLADAGDFLRSLPAMTIQIRLTGVETDGRRIELGTYRLAHGAE